MIGGDDGLAVAQVLEDLGVLSEVVDAVGVEDDYLVAADVLHGLGEEGVHVGVAPQPRPDDPAVDGLLPGLDLLHPLLYNLG